MKVQMRSKLIQHICLAKCTSIKVSTTKCATELKNTRVHHFTSTTATHHTKLSYSDHSADPWQHQVLCHPAKKTDLGRFIFSKDFLFSLLKNYARDHISVHQRHFISPLQWQMLYSANIKTGKTMLLKLLRTPDLHL